MTILPGDTVRLRCALPAQQIAAGTAGRVVRVCNGWLDVRFGDVTVRGIDPAMVIHAGIVTGGTHAGNDGGR